MNVQKVKNTAGGLRFRNAIRCALDACHCTRDSIALRCGVTRQTISLFLTGKCAMRQRTAQAIADAMVSELHFEIKESTARIEMFEKIIADVKNTYNREYAGGVDDHEWPVL